MIQEKDRIFLYDVAGYDAAAIAERVGAAMDKLLIKPKGRVLVRPDCDFAHPELFPDDYTRPEVLDGVLQALRARWTEDCESLHVGARGTAGLPTRLPFGSAGYLPLCKRHEAEVRYFEEERAAEVPLADKDRLRPSLWVPEPVADATFRVGLPKLGTHPGTTLWGGLASNLGWQDDGPRLLDHDHRLGHKLCDLASALKHELVVVDGISARVFGREACDLGLLIIGTNPVATDAIICRLLGLQPADVEHVRLAHERGLGPVALPDIAMRGDVSLQEACARAEAKGFLPRQRHIEDVVKDSRIRAAVGPPPGSGPRDRCLGGCPAAAEIALDVVGRTHDDAPRHALPLLLVFGDHAGQDLSARPNEETVLVGDCAHVAGRVGRQAMVSESTWIDAAQRDSLAPTAPGMISRLLLVLRTLWRSRNATHVRLPGCQVSVAEQILLLARVCQLKSPLTDRRVLLPLMLAWIQSAALIGYKRLGGKLKPRPALAEPEAEVASPGP